MVNDQMVNKFMKSVTNRAFMAKKRMYKKPETEMISVKMTATLCGSQTVGFGSGKGSGPALAPKRSNEIDSF